MKAVILGSGSAYGCPMAFNKWRQLNPHNLKNVRNRASVYLEVDGKKFIVDAGPEFRLEVNKCGLEDVDAVFITHGTMTILPPFRIWHGPSTMLEHQIEVWSSSETETELPGLFRILV